MTMAATVPTRKVLVVDDSKFVRATFTRILEASFAVRAEADGESALKAIQEDNGIVMVFSDLNMPKMDGFGLLQKIRSSADKRVKSLPVVIISGEEDEKSKKRARDAGANDFIAKSADGAEVLARIDNLLKLVHANEELETAKEAVQQQATRDPVTGTFTLNYLLTEGRKHHSHAKRHGSVLSVINFRIETFPDWIKKVGPEVAGKLLERIARAVIASLRAEDSIGRTGDAIFTVISPSTDATQAVAFARRLREQLEKAQVNYNNQALAIKVSAGIASLPMDPGNTIEELIKTAAQRMKTEVVAPAVPAAPVQLPTQLEQAIALLERVDPARHGPIVGLVVKRLAAILEKLRAK
jgi:two-component system, cell cycle response regulator